MARLHVPIHLRWSDLDAYGHVNNAAMFVLLEEARIRAFWTNPDDLSAANSVLSLVAHQEIEYLAPVPYLGQALDVQIWVGRLGGASAEICYEVWSPRDEVPAVTYARATTTVVLVDAVTQKPTRVDDRRRAIWSEYVDERLVISKRN